MWKTERRQRITASKFHSILIREKDFDGLAVAIKRSHETDLSHVQAIAHGVKYETPIRKAIQELNPEYILREVGLVVNPLYPHLGASPDGLLFSKTFGAKLIEIKCIY